MAGMSGGQTYHAVHLVQSLNLGLENGANDDEIETMKEAGDPGRESGDAR